MELVWFERRIGEGIEDLFRREVALFLKELAVKESNGPAEMNIMECEFCYDDYYDWIWKMDLCIQEFVALSLSLGKSIAQWRRQKVYYNNWMLPLHVQGSIFKSYSDSHVHYNPMYSPNLIIIKGFRKFSVILEFHDSSLFRHSLSFNSYMQRYEELNKVGEGMRSIAGNID